MIGLVLVLLVVLTAVFADQLSPSDPNRQNIPRRLTGPFWMTGDLDYVLGSDSLGRDILTRIIHGARISCWWVYRLFWSQAASASLSD